MIDWVDALTAAGISIASVAALCRFFGERIVERWFERQAEAQRQVHRKQLEEIRLALNLSFSRFTRIHEREFEVLPEAWRLLLVATGKSAAVVHSWKEGEDLNLASPARLEEVLARSELAESAMQEVRESDNKNHSFHEAMFWRELNDALAAISEFSNYVLINSIFLPTELRAKLIEHRDLLMDAAHGMKRSRQYSDHEGAKAAMIAMGEPSEALKKEVEALIQGRLESARSAVMPAGSPE